MDLTFVVKGVIIPRTPIPPAPTGQMPRQLFCYVNFDQLPTISVTKTVTGIDALIRALQRVSNKQIPVNSPEYP